MTDRSTPSIEVTIGRQTRLYHAFITTAPAVFDAPSTVTLYAGPLQDIAGLAADDLALDTEKAGTPSRLVTIDTTELGWQLARCRAKSHRSSPADPVLVGFTTCSSGSGSDCRWRNWRLPDASAAIERRRSGHDEHQHSHPERRTDKRRPASSRTPRSTSTAASSMG